MQHIVFYYNIVFVYVNFGTKLVESGFNICLKPGNKKRNLTKQKKIKHPIRANCFLFWAKEDLLIELIFFIDFSLLLPNLVVPI